MRKISNNNNKKCVAFNSTRTTNSRSSKVQKSLQARITAGFFISSLSNKVYLNLRAYPHILGYVRGYMVYVVMRVPPAGIVEAVMVLTDVQVKNTKPGDSGPSRFDCDWLQPTLRRHLLHVPYRPN